MSSPASWILFRARSNLSTSTAGHLKSANSVIRGLTRRSRAVELINPLGPLMQEYINRFSDYLKYQRNASVHTQRNYLSDLDQFYDYLCPKNSEGERPAINIRDINHITIREYMAMLYKENRKKSSIARKLATLRTFFKFLCREQILELNPARLVSSPRL